MTEEHFGIEPLLLMFFLPPLLYTVQGGSDSGNAPVFACGEFGAVPVKLSCCFLPRSRDLFPDGFFVFP